MFNKYIISVTFICLLACSCKKYLDITPLGQAVLTTFSDYDKLLDNTATYTVHSYSETEIKYLNDQTGFDDNNIPANSSPTFISTSYLFDTTTSRFSVNINSGLYSNAYAAIARLCLIIDNVTGAAGGTDAQKKQLIAEARVLRAYAHFITVNVYAKPYNPATALMENAIPIKLHENLEEMIGPSTTAQVYSFIESELLAAIPDLSNTPKNTFHPSKAFGYAFLAKMYLFERKFDKAQTAARQSLALNNYIFDLVAYNASGMVNPIDISMQENTYYAFATTGNYPGPGSQISTDMYNFFGVSDMRRTVFFSTGINSSGCTSNFSKNLTGTSSFAYNAVGIRVPEVYLMLAECYARVGDVTNAVAMLDTVRSKRMSPFVPSAAPDATTAVNLIINERRKELLFGFNRFWDQRRLAQDPNYAVTATRIFPYVDVTRPHITYKLSPNSFFYTIPFDKKTMQANTKLLENTNDVKNW
ncbi:RagB/SusD family nutrient uptake outer membrane protein [Chitinophagaceae bacterium LWZ2-11]